MSIFSTIQNILIKILVIFLNSGMNDGMVGLKSLNIDISSIEMATADTADNLSEEVKSAFLGGEIGKRKTSIGLDNANSSKQGEIKAFSNGLSADDNVEIAIFDVIKLGVKRVGLGIVGIKTSDFGRFEKLF